MSCSWQHSPLESMCLSGHPPEPTVTWTVLLHPMDRRSVRDLTFETCRGERRWGELGELGEFAWFPPAERQEGRSPLRFTLHFTFMVTCLLTLTSQPHRREKAGQLAQLAQLAHALVPCAKRTHAPTAGQHGRGVRFGLHRRRRRGEPASWEPRDGRNAALRANLKSLLWHGRPTTSAQ